MTSTARNYSVRTTDVDGSSTRYYATFSGAAKRFEEMAGLTAEQALSEMFFDADSVPAPSEAQRIIAVSMYGTKVQLTCVSWSSITAAEDAAAARIDAEKRAAEIKSAEPARVASAGAAYDDEIFF